jgi:hypothetical protein
MYIGECMSAGVDSEAVAAPSIYQVMVSAV